MWWGRYSNENGRRRWRSGFGPWENNPQPIDEQDETRIEPGMSETEIDARLRRRILLRRKMYREFFGHLVSFAAVNIILWSIWYASTIDGSGVVVIGLGDTNFPWPLFVTLFWGFGLVSHGMRVYQSSGNTAARREQAMKREIELERVRLGLERADYEKPKRVILETNAAPEKNKRQADSSRVRLSDDGELIPVEDDEQGTTDANYNRRQGGQ
jgi:hypothetical protein